ncbi:MAG: energy transducer TonB [Terracidiphilus sp.]|jgi:TonB family protein
MPCLLEDRISSRTIRCLSPDSVLDFFRHPWGILMRREFTIALIAFLPVPFAAAQQTIPPTPPPGASAPTSHVDPIDVIPPGPYKIGGRISAPVIKHRVTAQYTDEARRANYQGACLIGLIVNAQGNPVNVHVVRPLGMGLDEKAMDAIRQYKFKPAMKDGKTPVPVMVTIEVDFRLG